jgi:hypothetical protein
MLSGLKPIGGAYVKGLLLWPIGFYPIRPELLLFFNVAEDETPDG